MEPSFSIYYYRIYYLSLFGLALIFISSPFLKAQNTRIDSLNFEFKKALHDTDRVQILIGLAEEYKEIKPDSCIALCNKALETIEKHNGVTNDQVKRAFNGSIGFANNKIGFIYNFRGDVFTATNYFKKALNAFELFGDELACSSALNNLGFISMSQGENEKALSYFEKCIKIYERLLKKLTKGDKIKAKQGVATGFTNMGVIFVNLHDYTSAQNYLFKSLKINEEIDDKRGMYNSLVSIAGTYTYQNKFTEALTYFNKALEVLKTSPNKMDESTAFSSMAYLYQSNNDFDNAILYYKKAIQIKEEISEYPGISHAYFGLAKCYFSKKNLKKALECAQLSLEIGEKIGSPRRIGSAAKILSDIYFAMNNPKQALVMYKLNIEMRDSLNNESARKASIKSQLKYEYEKKASADSVKNAEEQRVKDARLNAQKASLSSERTQRYTLYGGIVLVIGFLIFVFNRFRLTKKQKQIIEKQKVIVDEAFHKLEEKNKEVLDSIYYARRIQRALITSEFYIQKHLKHLRKEISEK